MIEFDRVGHAFPDSGGGATTVLRDVTVHLSEHRIGVIGANGSGKSTFARMLNALVVPSSGHVRIDGLDSAREARTIRRRVGFCFTDPDAQIVMPTVQEDLAFSLRRWRLPKDEVTRRVDASLDSYGLRAHRAQPAHLLSGGQKQLLALAAVLITDPELVVMDEPTTLLDLANAQRIRDLVSRLAPQVVLATHHLDLLTGFDRVLVLHEGRLVFDGEPAEAIGHYQALVLS